MRTIDPVDGFIGNIKSPPPHPARTVGRMNATTPTARARKPAVSHPARSRPRPRRLTIALATAADRERIHHLRHDVYAREIGQHAPRADGRLQDALDQTNEYIIASYGGEMAGFVSLTPPRGGRYSIDKYFERAELPFAVDDGLFEARLLTVTSSHRGSRVAAVLMYAAFRWIEAHGGTHVVAIGRREVLSLYLRAGFCECGPQVQAGAATYHLLHARVAALREHGTAGAWPLAAIEREVQWNLGFPLRKPAACFHGGAFFDAVGPRFDQLGRVDDIINADVLDAWFPPAPSVMEELQARLPWLLRTSPPTACEGLVDTIASARGVPSAAVLPGAGSSDLIFRALPRWLTRRSRVLLLEPTYGEYAHVLENVIGCRVDRLVLPRERDYDIPLDSLKQWLARPYDLVVLVNPNSPTGRHVPPKLLLQALQSARPSTRVWIDETYVDFVDPAQSLEQHAAHSENLIVCKSMSKAYALSGARAAYLCAGPHQLEELRAFTPPWAVSLTAQLAAVRALQSPGYYLARWRETARLREELAADLSTLEWQVVPGMANFLLCHLRPAGPTAQAVVARCRNEGLFLRDAARMGSALGTHALRIAVKDRFTNQRMARLLSDVVGSA